MRKIDTDSSMMWPNENAIKFDLNDFNDFLEWATDIGASDIILEVGEPLCLKLDGNINEVSKRIIRPEELIIVLNEVYQPSAANEVGGANPLDFPYAILRSDDSILRFRVNVTACTGPNGSNDGFEIVLRTIPGTPPSHDDLGLEVEIMNTCEFKSGVILVTGPTGSGKSTLLAAILRFLAETKRKHIITYEAPIEFDLKSIPHRIAKVVQTEIPTHVKNFETGVANCLRRAPDYLLVGEGRDRETIEGIIRISNTGHLVYSTVHTNDVATTIPRMADEFQNEAKTASAKLIDSMRMIIHQRLEPKREGGRVALREFLLFNDDIRRHLQICLTQDKDLTNEIKTLVRSDGQSLVSDALAKFKSGDIDLTTYARIVNEVGTADDLKTVPEVIESLYQNGSLTDDEHLEWKEEFNEYGK